MRQRKRTQIVRRCLSGPGAYRCGPGTGACTYRCAGRGREACGSLSGRTGGRPYRGGRLRCLLWALGIGDTGPCLGRWDGVRLYAYRYGVSRPYLRSVHHVWAPPAARTAARLGISGTSSVHPVPLFQPTLQSPRPPPPPSSPPIPLCLCSASLAWFGLVSAGTYNPIFSSPSPPPLARCCSIFGWWATSRAAWCPSGCRWGGGAAGGAPEIERPR